MVRRSSEKVERLFKIMEDIKKDSLSGATVLVEGRHDAYLLRSIGVTNVLTMRSINSLIRWAEQNAGSILILLMDFDKEGIMLTKKIKSSLSGMSVKVDTSYHSELMHIARKFGRMEVEDLIKLLKSFM